MAETNFLREPLDRKSVVDKIVENITNAIINGELKPGDRLPTETELSDSMRAGRNSVREAIKILEAYGVVHIRRAEGTFVNDSYDARMIYPVLYGIILQGDAAGQISGLRKVLDVGVLQLAVERLAKEPSKSYLESVERAMEELERVVSAKQEDIREIHSADLAFHRAIVQITDNCMIEAICDYVDKITRRSRVLALHQIIDSGSTEEFLELHRRMVRLLRERDAGAVYQTVEDHYRYWAKDGKE